MEIPCAEDVGVDLKPPSAACGGGATASCVLAPAVRPGDVVVLYDSRREAIVGVSGRPARGAGADLSRYGTAPHEESPPAKRAMARFRRLELRRIRLQDGRRRFP
jgi:hypothetical protein